MPRISQSLLLLVWSGIALLLCPLSSLALDVEVVETTCDNDLPVTADIYLKCESGARCTFGNASLVTGTCTYTKSSYWIWV
jgi:hypothetical protein